MTTPQASDALSVRVKDLAKAFGATQAIRHASLELRRGQVNCVVGENGSGKSTVVKILAGVHRPDRGTVEVAGRPHDDLTPPRNAMRAGISTVFQEVLVAESRSVVDNVWLGVDGLFRSRLTEAEKRERAAETLTKLLGREVPLDTQAGELSLSDRQACCIARALVRDPEVLILDESTSALDIATRDRLFTIVRELSSKGVSTLFISHRMDEIAEIGDRCTVMRSGETVASLSMEEATPDELIRLMTGSEHLAPSAARETAAQASTGSLLLSAKGIVLRPGAEPIDLDVRGGELIGLAGLEGHGQDLFLKALWGLGAIDWGLDAVQGEVRCDGTIIDSPKTAAAQGVGYVPRERRSEALFESKSIRENFGMPTLDDDRRGPLIQAGRTRSRLSSWVSRMNIKLANAEDLITTLSGGNQQKVVIARWLATDPKVLLLNDPTRGIDIGAKRDLYTLLSELAANGLAIVMLSTEVDEHVELMSRVLVFREHQLSAEIPREGLSRQALVSAFFGTGKEVAA